VILCGHCGMKHNSIDEVRTCSLRTPAQLEVPELNPEHDFPEPPLPADKVGQLEPGFYQTDYDHIYKVVISQKGFAYALLLVAEQHGHGWEYAAGAVKNIKPEHRMSLEDAKRFGRESGRCMVCGRELTNPESIEAGIGPVCAGKW